MVRYTAVALVLAGSLSPCVSAQAPAAKVRESIREGVFITARPGGLVKVSTGDWVFVPQDTGEGPKLRAMVLLPCQTLTRLEAGAQLLTGQAAGVVSGQVFVYRGREYLLPTAYRIIAPEEMVKAAPAPTTSSEPTSADKASEEKPGVAPTHPTDLEHDPSVEELVRDLESRKTQPRALTPRTGGADRLPTQQPAAAPTPASGDGTKQGVDTGAASATAPTGDQLAEGKVLTSMRGRVTRTPEGELAFSRDGDPDSPTGGPMVLLPCQTLQSIEELTAWRGESLIIEVGGRAFEFENRRYLLPTMFVVQPPSDTRPTQ